MLAGASFGGWIAAEWAIRYSDSLKTLVLIDPLGLRLDEAPAADVFGLDACAAASGVRRSGRPLAMEILPETPKADAIVSTILAGALWRALPGSFPTIQDCGAISSSAAPTLILWGERDGFVPAAHGKAYHEGIAGSKFTTLPSSAICRISKRRQYA